MKKIYIIIVLFIIASTANGFSQPLTYSVGDEDFPSTKYELQAGIGNEHVAYGDGISSDDEESATGGLRRSRPNIDEDESVGGVIPVGNGMSAMLFLALGFTFVKMRNRAKLKHLADTDK